MSSVEEISEYTSINQECWEIDNWPEQTRKRPTSSKSSLSESRSLTFSSCNEDGVSEEEGEKKVHSDASSTKVIFYREFTDTSKISLDDRRAPSQRPAKRRSFCSKLEIKKRTKLLKGIEGSEESSDNFSKLQAKVRLRKVETVTYSRRLTTENNASRHKGRTYVRPRSALQEKPEADEDAAKYSESIFRVFLKPEGLSVFQQKRQEKEHRSPPRQSALRRPKRESDDCHSECSVLTEGTVEPETVVEVAYPAFPQKIILSPERVKKASSKRSVHWEDEVTFIERSSSSMSSSCGTWENDYIHIYNKKVPVKKIEKKKTNVLNDEKKSSRYKERVRKKMLKKLFQMEGHYNKKGCINSDDSSCNTIDSNASQVIAEQVQPRIVCCHRSKSAGPPVCLSVKDPNHIPTFGGSLSKCSNDHWKNKTKKLTKKPLNPDSTVKAELLRKSIRGRRNTDTHLKRRRSSPAVVDRGNCNRKTAGDSSSTTLLDCKPSEKVVDPAVSNTIENAMRLKFQCGENNFKEESDCHYEEVSAATVLNRDVDVSLAVVNEPNMARHEGCDIANDASATDKCQIEDVKNISTETLRECILALQRIKNLSPPSPRSRIEHLGLVQGIQCSLLGMQEKLLNDKLCKLNSLVKSFDVPRVEEPKPPVRKKYTKYSNRLQHNAANTLKDKGYNVKETATVCKREKLFPEKQISPKSSKILKSWENMKKNISERREKLWNDLQRKRENTDSSNLAESDETFISSKNNSDGLNETEISTSTTEPKLVFFVHEEISDKEKSNEKKEGSSLNDESKTDIHQESINVKRLENVNPEKRKRPKIKEFPCKVEQLQVEPVSKIFNVSEHEQSSSTEGVMYEDILESSKVEIGNILQDTEHQIHGPSNELSQEISHYKEISYEATNAYKFVLINKRDVPFVIKKMEPEQASSVDFQNSAMISGISCSNDVDHLNCKDPVMTSNNVPQVTISEESTQLYFDTNPMEKCDEYIADSVKEKDCPKQPSAAKNKKSVKCLQKKGRSKESIRVSHSVKSRESIGPLSRMSDKSCSSVGHSENSETQPVSGPSSLESVDTVASRALVRPPSRKPFFERNEQENEGNQDDPGPTGYPASSSPERSDNFMRGLDDAGHKQPPPPRMYSTLKEKRTSLIAGKRSEVNEKLESAIKSLNNKCLSNSRMGKDCASTTSPSRGSSNESIKKRISEMRQRDSKPPEMKPEREKSGVITKTYEEKVEFPTPAEEAPIALPSSETNDQQVSSASHELTRKISESESIRNLKNQNKTSISGGQVPSPSKPTKPSKISNSTENMWGLKSTLDRRAHIQERLRNYVPPWERLNLKPPNTEIGDKHENKLSKEGKILEKPLKLTGRSLSNPQNRSNNFDIKLTGKLGGGSSPCSPVRSLLAQRQARSGKKASA